jgi:hypothetical protein
MDHYEINARWQELAVVVSGKEVPAVYVPRAVDMANPLSGPRELACRLFELAKLEHVLALEYLYAYFSVKSPQDAGVVPNSELWKELTFIRNRLLTTAISEMHHLRWVNQLLWQLYDRFSHVFEARVGPSLCLPQAIPDGSARDAILVGFEDKPEEQRVQFLERVKSRRFFQTKPKLLRLGEIKDTAQRYGLEYLTRAGGPARRLLLTVPRRRPALRDLIPATLDDFIAVEEPSGGIDGQYAVITATLRQPKCPDAFFQLASRIVTDGEDHYNHFRDVALLLKTNGWADAKGGRGGNTPYLREGLRLAKVTDEAVEPAVKLYEKILEDLFVAYEEGDIHKDRFSVADARHRMQDLSKVAESLATRKADPVGIPFFDIANNWTRKQGTKLPISCPVKDDRSS